MTILDGALGGPRSAFLAKLNARRNTIISGMKPEQPAAKRPPAQRGQGRKPFPDGEAMHPVTFRLKPAQKEKVARLGGSEWVRQQIDQAKEPKA